MLEYIAQQTQLSKSSIQNTIKLLDQDCTIPFISRYRKEVTGNLDEIEIGEIVKYKEQFETLIKRKETVLKALLEQNVLNDELKAKIESAQDLTTLEDIYLPFKKKKKTKAEQARKNGLEPLAKIIMSQRVEEIEHIARRYVSNDIIDEDQALEGARHIIAEWINERTVIRNGIRNQLERYAQIETKVVKTKKDEEPAQKFKDYFDWSESLNRCPSHRLLAMLRGEQDGFIRLSISIDHDRALQMIESRIIKSKGEVAHQIQLAIKDAYKRLLYPSLSKEILSKAKEKADIAAIEVFANNLKQLLLGAPLGSKSILGVDPGYRSGCKLVCLDTHGNLKYNETIFPHPPKNDFNGAIKKIRSLVDAYKIEAIAIGNGTASRETEQLIRKVQFNRDVEVFVVSEAGASIYSASKIARDEFPNYDVTVRGAVSIGRRLADPLAELVKIDPKSIGVGQYQHDVDQIKLKKSLDTVVESCVNTVGVNLNTASNSLLSYVSGIGPKLAESIVEYRQKNNGFASRLELKKVPRLGEKAFEQAAGFLRIPKSTNPLDNSTVHPENYPVVKAIAKDMNVDMDELIGNSSLIAKIKLEDYVNDRIGLLTLQDIVKELEKPGLDPRGKAKVFTFDQNVKTINDLEIGMRLPGIINNITNFGCFVDIGIKESGLVHVSNLSDTFVKDINALVSLHQQVIVKVLQVDFQRKRIQLSLKQD